MKQITEGLHLIVNNIVIFFVILDQIALVKERRLDARCNTM